MDMDFGYGNGFWLLYCLVFKKSWEQTDLMKLRNRIEEGMEYIDQTIKFAPAENPEDISGFSCFKCCVRKTGDETGNDMNMTPKLSNYSTTFSIINDHLDKLRIRTMKRSKYWPEKYFVLQDARAQENGDWQILFDKFKDISKFVAEPGIRLVVYASLRRVLKELLLVYLELIEEIVFACHDGNKHVSNDIGWFEARCSLYGDSGYKKYYDGERPKAIAGELQAVLKKHPSKTDSQKILFIDFPWDWPNLLNELWDREKSLGVRCELYQLDYHSGTFSKCKMGCDPGEESSWEKIDAKRLLFDTVICWHVMEHCSKIFSKLFYRKIINKLKHKNGLLILFLAVSRDPEIDTIAIERSCEYTAFHAEKLLGKKIANPSKIFFDYNLSFRVTKVDEEDGQMAPAAWQIVLEEDKDSIYGYLLKFQDDYLIYWKHPNDVIQAGGKIISSLSSSDLDKAAELFKKEKHLDDKFPSEIEIIRRDDSVILKYFDTPFLCYAYTPRNSPDRTPAEETEDIVNALWTHPDKQLIYLDKCDDPFFTAMKKYKLEKCRDYCKREFFHGKSEKSALSVDVFLHASYDFDTEAYVRFQYEGKWYVTYFPTMVYMNERLAYAKLCAYERDGQYPGSVTHQISRKTLEKRLADNNCRLQKIWYHNLGPRSAHDPDMKQILSQSGQDPRSVYSVLSDYLDKPHSVLTPPGKFSAKKKLLEWDVHDAMVVAYKNDSD